MEGHAVVAAEAAKQIKGENIALHCKVTFNKPPSYPLCTDSEDDKQITDGLYTTGEGSIWGHKSTVGWAGGAPIITTIDLGKVQPIGGVSFGTAAGVAAVTWPTSLLVMVSDDNTKWHFAGDLVQLSGQEGGNGLPPQAGYATHRFATNKLKTRGRYVGVVVPTGNYIFCDEIEVYRGAEELTQREAPGLVVTDIEAWVNVSQTHLAMLRRVSGDCTRVRSLLNESKLGAERKVALNAELDEAEAALAQIPTVDGEKFSTVIPQNDSHARILAIYGEVLAARGLPPVVAWKQAHRNAWLGLFDAPDKAPAASPSISVEMLGSEFRSDAFLLTNATNKSQAAKLKVVGMPGGAQPSWLRLSPVAWTDTAQGTPIAAALPEAKFQNGAYQIPLTAGLTRKVWLTIDSSKLPAGRHAGEIVVQAGSQTMRLPLRVTVSPVKLQRPRLSLGMWDYTNGNGAFGITPRNRDAAIALQKSHYVDSPWATGGALPQLTEKDFNAKGEITAKVSFDEFDDWVQRWPNARRYMVYYAATDTFAGAKIGSPEFKSRVGSWVKSLSQHMRDLKLDPGKLTLLLVDEPHTDEQDARSLAWTETVKAAAPELTIFTDPTWERPDLSRFPEAIAKADIVCPLFGVFYYKDTGKAASAYYAARQAAGQTLWLYDCDGPTRSFDPGAYFRGHAWHAFALGAQGIGFWSFGDSAYATSSWNEYAAKGGSYTPVFLSADGVTDGIHWQAVRDGMQDYEYLAMLRDVAAKTRNATLRNQANALLDEVSRTVKAKGLTERLWVKAGAATDIQAEKWRLQALRLLEKMKL